METVCPRARASSQPQPLPGNVKLVTASLRIIRELRTERSQLRWPGRLVGEVTGRCSRPVQVEGGRRPQGRARICRRDYCTYPIWPGRAGEHGQGERHLDYFAEEPESSGSSCIRLWLRAPESPWATRPVPMLTCAVIHPCLQ